MDTDTIGDMGVETRNGNSQKNRDTNIAGDAPI